jgi:hypothetical protein
LIVCNAPLLGDEIFVSDLLVSLLGILPGKHRVLLAGRAV